MHNYNTSILSRYE